ncbi:hypothetical protein N7456_009129 [Penicillium angulare]|uniref:Uncharacterized protein n=1 Tax=Penicillium angulare TaxID=116970 RepID=A0A9W9K4X4_9EURO|nr:hypothetical protein N7456_009129 [Penicillium angulare]
MGSPAASCSEPESGLISMVQLEKAFSKAWSPRSDDYKAVTALIIHYDDDDTGAKDDARELEKTFREKLQIHAVENIAIPTDQFTDPLLFVLNKILSMKEEHHNSTKAGKTLFILAYIGHGVLRKSWGQSTKDLCLQSSRGHHHVLWEQLISHAVQTPVDFLGILDCCSTDLHSIRELSPNTHQILAACGPDDSPYLRNHGARPTFTRSICHSIDIAAAGNVESFTTDWLIQEIHNLTPKPPGEPRRTQNNPYFWT